MDKDELRAKGKTPVKISVYKGILVRIMRASSSEGLGGEAGDCRLVKASRVAQKEVENALANLDLMRIIRIPRFEAWPSPVL